MAAKAGSEEPGKGGEDEAKPVENEKGSAPWLIPVVTVVLLAVAFCGYYFIYVGARRQYLANRNFRALALLGEQLQQRISIHSNILKFCADVASEANIGHRGKQKLERFLLVHKEDFRLPDDEKFRESLKDYLAYLSPSFELNPKSGNDRAGAAGLRVERRNNDWMLVLNSVRDYEGSLKLDDLMKPLVGSAPFDDILLVSNRGSIVYQQNKAGPQFTTLSALLQSQAAVADKAGKPSGEGEGSKPAAASAAKDGGSSGETPVRFNSDPVWRNRSLHLTDVVLAGVPYKLFLQPVLVSTATDSDAKKDAASEWVLCGLRSSAALDWEALSLSYTFFIWCTFAFFIVWANYKVLKIFFMNRRERLRLREFGTLGLSLLLLSTVLTLSLLQVNFRLTDDTDARLKALGEKFSGGIRDELRQMQNQLVNWCQSDELQKDLASVDVNNQEVIRNTPQNKHPVLSLAKDRIDSTPTPSFYPFTANAFWTDDDGHQIVKWSATQYVTPMIDVSQSPIFQRPAAHFDSDNLTFQVASLMPPNKVEFVATFGMKLRACAGRRLDPTLGDDIRGGAGFLTTQPLTLIDPILPYGFGFMLVDESGNVLFHSDKNRNGGENLRLETDDNRELYAAIYSHASQRSLPLTYRGTEYRALVVPAPGISQAGWSLIVFRDLTSVRTLDLQAMAVASTLLVLILAPLIVVASIRVAMLRLRYAPEWLWPNGRRIETYLYQIFLYTVSSAALLVVCFWGTVEAIVVSSAASVYTAALLTWWSYRVYPSAAEKPLARKARRLAVAPGVLAGGGAATLLGMIVLDWPRSVPEVLILLGGIVAVVPLLDRPRRLLLAGFHRTKMAARNAEWTAPESERRGILDYRRCYVMSVLLLLVLTGVLVPMSLFRAGLSAERRLEAKQEQRYLGSRVSERWTAIVAASERNQLSDAAWKALTENAGSPPPRGPWSWIVPVDLGSGKSDLWLGRHTTGTPEFYSGWWRWLLYRMHHDYNEASAELLGVIPDRGNTADWTWDSEPESVTLRWHGAHPTNQIRDPLAAHDDLLIASQLPRLSWVGATTCLGIILVVALVVGGLLRGLARKLFLFRVAPLTMKGARLLAEFVREGKNVVALLPPVHDWQLEAPKWTLDIEAHAQAAGWMDSVDFSAIPTQLPIEVQHFEFTTGDPEIDSQKFVLLERLKARRNGEVSVVVVMTVPVSADDYRRMFSDWEVVDMREEPFLWLKEYEGPAQHLIWNECRPIPALWPIGAQLAKDLREQGIYSRETVASEILERADAYYRLVWRECSKEQKFVLSHLAEDGAVNPMNDRAIQQLLRRGLITNDPQFRVVNESFRRFVRTAATADLKLEWLRESRHSGWGKAQGAFLTSMTLLGLFLLTTQNALWQSAAAYVTTALGALGTMAKLFDAVRARGGGGGEKAS